MIAIKTLIVAMLMLFAIALASVIYYYNVNNSMDNQSINENSNNYTQIIDHVTTNNTENTRLKNEDTLIEPESTYNFVSINTSNHEENIDKDEIMDDITIGVVPMGSTQIKAIESSGTYREFLRKFKGCVILVSIPEQYDNYIKVVAGEEIIVPLNVTFIGGSRCIYDKMRLAMRGANSLSLVYIPIENINETLLKGWSIFNTTSDDIVILSREMVYYDYDEIVMDINSSVIVNAHVKIPEFIIKSVNLSIQLCFIDVLELEVIEVSTWYEGVAFLDIMIEPRK